MRRERKCSRQAKKTLNKKRRAKRVLSWSVVIEIDRALYDKNVINFKRHSEINCGFFYRDKNRFLLELPIFAVLVPRDELKRYFIHIYSLLYFICRCIVWRYYRTWDRGRGEMKMNVETLVDDVCRYATEAVYTRAPETRKKGTTFASSKKKVDFVKEHDWVRGETETASIISKPWLIWVTGPR